MRHVYHAFSFAFLQLLRTLLCSAQFFYSTSHWYCNTNTCGMICLCLSEPCLPMVCPYCLWVDSRKTHITFGPRPEKIIKVFCFPLQLHPPIFWAVTRAFLFLSNLISLPGRWQECNHTQPHTHPTSHITNRKSSKLICNSISTCTHGASAINTTQAV